MNHNVEVRYLAIEWQDRGLARRVEAAPEPIEVRVGIDGAMTVEAHIFHDVDSWLGLQLAGPLTREHPALVAAGGERRPMLRVGDGHGGHWWVENGDWDAARQRHLSEMQRTMGRFEVAIGDRRLLVENVAGGAGGTRLEEYLQDLQGDLIWLALGFGGGAAQGRTGAGDELAAAVKRFATAARRVLGKPVVALREATAEARIARLRPNAATFRQHARMPAAQRLIGRTAIKTADLAENRHLRHMIQVCSRLSRTVAEAARQQEDTFRRRAEAEAERSGEYRTTTSRIVDPEVFDHDLSILREKLRRVGDYTDGDPPSGDAPILEAPLRLEGRSRVDGNRFFYRRIGAVDGSDERLRIRYSVVQLPAELARRLHAVLRFSGVHTLRGIATRQRRVDGNGNGYRLVHFEHVVSVMPDVRALAAKERKREILERDGWRVALGPKEHEEMRQEARTAELRADAYAQRAARAAETARHLNADLSELRRQDRVWGELCVEPSPAFPAGMVFSRNPNYAECLSAFRRVRELAAKSGVGDAALDAIERIGVLHASALYERWCLVKIIAVLVEDYGFVPELGWQDRVIRAVTGLPESLALEFRRAEPPMLALLEAQPVLANGKRPDFHLRFQGKGARRARGLIMDAKFRTKWKFGELASMLDDLMLAKDYAQEGDRVFILQPVKRAVDRVTSPLNWGRDCDYGQNVGKGHLRGAIHLAPSRGASNPVAHLRRLIALELQAAFPPPRRLAPGLDGWKSDSFCIRCGGPHKPGEIAHKLTKGNRDRWVLRCASCEMLTLRTHCFDCYRPLFKNGIRLTYHRTLADQITNVVCPSCGEYFDPDLRDDGGS